MITPLHPATLSAWEMNPRNRIDAKSLQPLIDSMRSVGWFGAIMVRPVAGEAGRYQVLAGERRWRAAGAVGLEQIMCEVREMSDRDAIELAVIENRDREDLDVIEEAGGYQAMVGLGWSVKEIATRSGRAERSIYLLLDLCGLPEAVQEALRDKHISMNVAVQLGKITDEALRAEALQRIAKPRMQDHPLSEKQAMPLIQREYLEPQKRQVAWEKKMKSLLKEFGASVEIKSVAEAGEITGCYSGYEACHERPAAYELAVHAREMDAEMIPTWGDLAEKHGARKVVVPDGEGEPVFYVERDPLVTAEQVLGEADPEACIFPLQGSGRHAQSVAAEKSFEELAAEKRQDAAEQQARQEVLVRALHDGLLAPKLTLRWGVERRQESFAEMARLLVRDELLDGLEAIPEALGVDVEALGDGDAQVGMERWMTRLMEVRSVDACAFVLAAYAVLNIFPGGIGAAEKIDALEEACGERKAVEVEAAPEKRGRKKA
jgi:ParB family chromosome partitioning protein